ELCIVDNDVVVSTYLVALDDVGEGHLMIAGVAPPLVFDRREVLTTQLAKRDRVRFGGDIQPDRNADHPEADDAFPHRTGHVHSGSYSTPTGLRMTSDRSAGYLAVAHGPQPDPESEPDGSRHRPQAGPEDAR